MGTLGQEGAEEEVRSQSVPVYMLWYQLVCSWYFDKPTELQSLVYKCVSGNSAWRRDQITAEWIFPPVEWEFQFTLDVIRG